MSEFMSKTKGKVKQAAGALADDKELQREGKADEAKGKLQGALDDAKHAVKDAVKKK